MEKGKPEAIYLKDYQAPDYLITDVYLTFELGDTKTQVTNVMKVKRNPKGSGGDLLLVGEELEFVSAAVDGRPLTSDDYSLVEEGLLIKKTADSFELEIHNNINPTANTALDGLYKSGHIYCSQNEPEGFRRITYYLDRPDVMARFKTKIIGDKNSCPVMLSNGNPVGKGDLDNGRHWIEWEDPYPKPCYLYALVAGDLGLVRDSYTTKSGREVALEIYVDKGNESKCDFAMQSLKDSMKWDEERFGLEYDLDIYMIVAVDSFNMGAMENKGLNIFNSAYVLANPDTATDYDYLGIQGVIGHEYFHNWTGNRITCRDWFQLTLKEGLTVFRDQEFSSDMNSRVVKRIEDVERLRARQFVEDAGPTSHPIKPDHYIEINNFYTATIYEKGAEVIRMIHTLLGEEGFRKGMDKYFELFDGQAVRTEDFLHAMAVANDYDFSHFKKWYSQAGTPEVTVKKKYDRNSGELTLKLSQKTKPTPDQDEKEALHIPLGLGLLDSNGNDMPLNLEGDPSRLDKSKALLHLKSNEEEFRFTGLKEEPIVSVNRMFSAPVKINQVLTSEELSFLMAHDNDPFNRFESSQELGARMVEAAWEDLKNGKEPVADKTYLDAFGKLLADHKHDRSLVAMGLKLPSLERILGRHDVMDVSGMFKARESVRKAAATTWKSQIIETYHQLCSEETSNYNVSPESVGRRDLKNALLGMISALEGEEIEQLIWGHYEKSTNMTDIYAAFSIFTQRQGTLATRAVTHFGEKWSGTPLVMQKWFKAQAVSPLDNTLDLVKKLEKHKDYDSKVPNYIRCLPFSFGYLNLLQFHREDGSGYDFISDKVLEVDKINPQMAGAMVMSFRDYKRLPADQKKKMEVALEKIKSAKDLSKNLFERFSKIIEE